ncbi:hypothetical protein BH20ACT9_BH20ACT9_11970 [soil metagenome]
MTLRADHFAECDRELLILAGQRLMGWAQHFTFHESDGETWYRTREDDPAQTVNLLIAHLDDADSALRQARRLLDQGLRDPSARAAREGSRR